MDSFDFNVKAEKVKAMKSYDRLRSMAKVFRVLEALSASLFLGWTFERVPFAVRVSGEFVSKLGGVIASPLFVFLVCNVIIATLIANSGIFSTVRNADSKLYAEISKNTESWSKSVCREEIVYQDKEIISEVKICASECKETDQSEPESELASDFHIDKQRVFRRSKSEKLEREKVTKKLRRSETENSQKFKNIDEKSIMEDELSNEEFQRAIEDFIAKQLRFRREESLSIVLQSQA